MYLSDGRSLKVLFEDHRFLRAAAPEGRANCVVESSGTALWWPALNEGISVAGLLGVSEGEIEALAGLAVPASKR